MQNPDEHLGQPSIVDVIIRNVAWPPFSTLPKDSLITQSVMIVMKS